MIDVSIERREVEFRLRVDFPGKDAQDIDRHFWVGQYDFPMLDNTQLPYGLRASVVITDFFVPEAAIIAKPTAPSISSRVFPAAFTSFKEREDYDDILTDMCAPEGAPLTRRAGSHERQYRDRRRRNGRSPATAAAAPERALSRPPTPARKAADEGTPLPERGGTARDRLGR